MSGCGSSEGMATVPPHLHLAHGLLHHLRRHVLGHALHLRHLQCGGAPTERSILPIVGGTAPFSFDGGQRGRLACSGVILLIMSCAIAIISGLNILIRLSQENWQSAEVRSAQLKICTAAAGGGRLGRWHQSSVAAPVMPNPRWRR